MFEPWPIARPEIWEAMRQFIEYWHRPIADADRTSNDDLDAASVRLALTVPTAIREFYGWIGNAKDIWSRQDELLPPSEWTLEDGVLVLCVESQCVVRWGVLEQDLNRPDPPVAVTDIEGPSSRLLCSESFSQWTLQYLLMQPKYWPTGTWWANGRPYVNTIEAVKRRFRQCPLPDLPWPESPTRFYVADDAVVEINGEGGPGSWPWLTCREEGLYHTLLRKFSDCQMEWETRCDE